MLLMLPCVDAFAFASHAPAAYAARHSPPHASPPRIRLLAESPNPLTGVKLGSLMSNAFLRMTDFRVARASHILLKGFDDATVQQMQAWKSEITDDPARFAEIASAHSLCPSRAKGGDLGFFTRGKMVKEFDSVVFVEKPGAVYGPIRTDFGNHVRSAAHPRLHSSRLIYYTDSKRSWLRCLQLIFVHSCRQP